MDLNRHCLRPLINAHAFLDTYRANGIPNPIPRSLKEYQKLLDTTQNLIRDYSFITFSHFGTIEFRSACSQNTLSSIIQLISLRMAILQYCIQDPKGREIAPSIYWNVCEKGLVPKDIIKDDLKNLSNIQNPLPKEVKTQLKTFFDRTSIHTDFATH